MDEGVGDDVDLVAVVARVVARRGVRAAGEEQVREAVGLDAEERRRALGPVVGEGQAVPAHDAHAQHGPGAEVEPGGPDDDVDLVDAVGGLDPGLGQPHDGGLPEVDQRHVRPVEGLEVPGDVRRPLLAVAVVLGDECFGGVRVVDRGADLPGDEVTPLGVGLGVVEDVDVVAGELPEAGAGPHLLEEGLPLLGGVLEGAPGVQRVVEAVDRGVEHLAQVLEPGPELGLLLGGDGPVVERGAPVGGPLEDLDGGDLLRDGRHHLHPARRGADHGHPLAREIHRFGGPLARVVLHPAEILAARHIRDVGHRQHPGGGDEEPGSDGRAVLSRDRPGPRPLVPDGGGDGGAEAHVAAEVEAVDHVVEVALDLGLLGEVLLPRPLVEELLGEEVPVGVALGVEAGAGVAVPEPGAADAVTGLEQARGEPLLQRPVQLVDAGDAGAHDQDVDVGLRHGGGLYRSVRCGRGLLADRA